VFPGLDRRGSAARQGVGRIVGPPTARRSVRAPPTENLDSCVPPSRSRCSLFGQKSHTLTAPRPLHSRAPPSCLAHTQPMVAGLSFSSTCSQVRLNRPVCLSPDTALSPPTLPHRNALMEVLVAVVKAWRNGRAGSRIARRRPQQAGPPPFHLSASSSLLTILPYRECR
jgi:hypothetical protein